MLNNCEGIVCWGWRVYFNYSQKINTLAYYNLIYSSTIMVALTYFPRAKSSSIIDRQGLNFCVRNGNRYFPKPHQYHRYSKWNPFIMMRTSITIVLYITFKKTINLARSISMSMLNPLLDVHTTPINPVVYWGSYLRRESNLILK